MTIVAVLAQNAEAVRRYLGQHPLPFPVLVDASREVVKAYGVWHRVGLDAWNIARPALFLIAQNGTIVRSFVAARQDEFPSHAELIAWLENLEPKSSNP